MAITKVGVSGLFVAKETLEVLLQSRNFVNSKGELLSRAPGGFCLPGGRLEDYELDAYLKASDSGGRRSIADEAFRREMSEESGRPIPHLNFLPQPYHFQWNIKDGMPEIATGSIPGLATIFDYSETLVEKEFSGKEDYLYPIILPRKVVHDIASHWQEGRGAVLLPIQYTTGIRGIPPDHAMLLSVFADYVSQGKLNGQKVL